MRFTKKLETVLFKSQADPVVPEPDLDDTNYQDVLEGSQIVVNIDSTEIDTVGPTFDQPAAVPGQETAVLTMIYPLRGFGVEGAPDFLDALECCGWKSSQDGGYYIFTPSGDPDFTSSEIPSGTAWGYYGKNGITNCDKVSMFHGNVKITVEGGKIGKLEISGKCAHDDCEAETMPEVTRNRTVVPGVIGATVLINGQAFKMLNLEIDAGQDSGVCLDISNTNGCGVGTLTNRKIKWTAKVYADAVESLTPYTAIREQAEAAIQCYWGSLSAVKIDAAYSQITKCDKSDQNGITTWDLAGQCNRNDFTLKILAGPTSS